MAEQRDAAAPREPVVTQEIAAEAAVWIARLHGPDRSETMERECRQWQARSAAHRLAFERCTDTWEDVPLVKLVDAYASFRSTSAERSGQAARGSMPRWVVAAVAACVLLGGVLLVLVWRASGTYTTGVGEQQFVVLEDGTRMSLNTSTRARVAFDRSRRVVSVLQGEALFEVTKDAGRPFLVRVADSEVEAHGTVFSVRLIPELSRANDELAVTLIEGRVTVRAVSGALTDGVAPATPLPMQPGERLRVGKPAGSGAGAHSVQVDRPKIDQIVAWKRAEAIFDDESLADAVAEMNRYNREPIVLASGDSLGQLRISGVYRTGDSAGFVQAVAALHGLIAREAAGHFELSTKP